MRQLLYWIFRRVFTFLGDIRLCCTPPKVRGEQIRKIMATAKPGNVLLRSYDYYLDSLYLPGNPYTHSAIVIDDKSVMHSVGEGVEKCDIIDFCCNVDHIAIVKLGNVDTDKIVQKAMELEGCEYNFLLTDPNRYYCHQFTATCLQSAGVFVRQFPQSILTKKVHLYLAQSFVEIAGAIVEVK